VRARIRCDGQRYGPLKVFLFRGEPAAGSFRPPSRHPDSPPARRATSSSRGRRPRRRPEFLALYVDYQITVAQIDRTDDRTDLPVTITASDSEAPPRRATSWPRSRARTGPGAVAGVALHGRRRLRSSGTGSRSMSGPGTRFHGHGVGLLQSPGIPPTRIPHDSGLRSAEPQRWRQRDIWWSIQYPNRPWEPEPAPCSSPAERRACAASSCSGTTSTPGRRSPRAVLGRERAGRTRRASTKTSWIARRSSCLAGGHRTVRILLEEGSGGTTSPSARSASSRPGPGAWSPASRSLTRRFPDPGDLHRRSGGRRGKRARRHRLPP